MESAGRRLLITGGSGTLGGPLCAQADSQGWQVYATYFSRLDRIRAGVPVQLDLRDLDTCKRLVDEVRPQSVIHTAVTERSGPGYEEAIRLAGRHMAQICAERGIRLVALSTDLVFDGDAPIYTEDSPAQPHLASTYGQAKLDAEFLIRELCPTALVVRTGLIYDFDRHNPQVAWMLRALEAGQSLRLFTDQIRCPIWVENLAAALLELVDTAAAGLLHVVGPETMSRYQLAVSLLDALEVDASDRVEASLAPESAPKTLNLSVERARLLLTRTPLLSFEQARGQWEAARGDR